MYISYDHYRNFYYVAKYASFTKAAEILMNNQPNLTRSVKALENELNCVLFIRSNQGVRLTQEGEKLYEHISVAFEHIRQAEEELSLGLNLKKGTVSIGTSEIALRCFLLPILSEFHSLYPGIHIKLTNQSTSQAISALKNGLVDFAVVTTPLEVPNNLFVEKVKDFQEIAVCGSAFGFLSQEKQITLNQLNRYPLISLGSQTNSYGFFSQLFAQKSIRFAPDIEVATADQILPLVKHNLGIGFIPEDFLTDSNSDSVYKLDLSETIPARSVCIVTQNGHTLNSAAKALKKMIIRT